MMQDGPRIVQPEPEAIRSLAVAAADWADRGDPAGCRRWLARELDGDGVPRRLPIAAWWTALNLLADATRRRPGVLPDEFATRVAGLFRAALRFARPDGSAAFGTGGAVDDRR